MGEPLSFCEGGSGSLGRVVDCLPFHVHAWEMNALHVPGVEMNGLAGCLLLFAGFRLTVKTRHG